MKKTTINRRLKGYAKKFSDTEPRSLHTREEEIEFVWEALNSTSSYNTDLVLGAQGSSIFDTTYDPENDNTKGGLEDDVLDVDRERGGVHCAYALLRDYHSDPTAHDFEATVQSAAAYILIGDQDNIYPQNLVEVVRRIWVADMASRLVAAIEQQSKVKVQELSEKIMDTPYTELKDWAIGELRYFRKKPASKKRTKSTH